MIAGLLGEPVHQDEEVKTEEVNDEAEAAAKHDPIKNPNSLLIVYQTRIELLYMQQRMEFANMLYQPALETANKLIEHQRKIIDLTVADKCAERSELANLIHLKGQAMERCQLGMEENLKCQEEAIELEELNAEESGKQSDLLCRLYRVKAHMCEYLGQAEEAVLSCEKALAAYRARSDGDHSEVIGKLEGYITAQRQ